MVEGLSRKSVRGSKRFTMSYNRFAQDDDCWVGLFGLEETVDRGCKANRLLRRRFDDETVNRFARMTTCWPLICFAISLAGEFLLGVEEAADAVEGAGFAEDDHAFEQRRRHGAAGDDGSEEHEVFFDGPLLLLRLVS